MLVRLRWRRALFIAGASRRDGQSDKNTNCCAINHDSLPRAIRRRPVTRITHTSVKAFIGDRFIYVSK
jgi:hypothetical protein